MIKVLRRPIESAQYAAAYRLHRNGSGILGARSSRATTSGEYLTALGTLQALYFLNRAPCRKAPYPHEA